MGGRKQPTALEGCLLLLGIIIAFVYSHPLVSGLILVVVVIIAVSSALIRQRRRAKMRALLLAAGTANPMQLTPEQYEQFCAALLENNGWNIRLTAQTRDFGADIIAHKNGQKMVVQCKQWSKPVGIKAVQEAYAAMSYYHATRAVVVTTTGYTAAAMDLSRRTGVKLLGHEDLTRI